MRQEYEMRAHRIGELHRQRQVWERAACLLLFFLFRFSSSHRLSPSLRRPPRKRRRPRKSRWSGRRGESLPLPKSSAVFSLILFSCLFSLSSPSTRWFPSRPLSLKQHFAKTGAIYESAVREQSPSPVRQRRRRKKRRSPSHGEKSASRSPGKERPERPRENGSKPPGLLVRSSAGTEGEEEQEENRAAVAGENNL